VMRYTLGVLVVTCCCLYARIGETAGAMNRADVSCNTLLLVGPQRGPDIHRMKAPDRLIPSTSRASRSYD
jgi:hypothetical protein